MIKEEHLKHWMKEIKWQLEGLRSELSHTKEQGIMMKDGFISFEYLDEKRYKIERLLGMIEYDVNHDNIGTVELCKK